MAKFENLDIEIVSCDEAYLNGFEDGKEEAAQERYDAGYEDGYRRGLADAIACEDKLT